MNIVERAKNILLSPAKEWEVIKGEQWTVQELFVKYALILAAIPAIAGFLGNVLFGTFGYKMPVSTALTWAVLTYVLSLAGVFIIAFIVDVLAPSFGSTKDLAASMKVVVFSYTAAWVAGVLNIIPALGIIGLLASIYSLVLMYMGLEKVKEVPKDKMIGYFVVVILVAIVVYVIIGAIINAATLGGLMMRSY